MTVWKFSAWIGVAYDEVGIQSSFFSSLPWLVVNEHKKLMKTKTLHTQKIYMNLNIYCCIVYTHKGFFFSLSVGRM